jgi:hypothetical protein
LRYHCTLYGDHYLYTQDIIKAEILFLFTFVQFDSRKLTGDLEENSDLLRRLCPECASHVGVDWRFRAIEQDLSSVSK